MAARKGLLQLIEEMIHDGRRGMPKVGELPEKPFKDLQRLNKEYRDPTVRMGHHAASSRYDKDGWSEEKIAEAIEQILGSDSTRGIPNFHGRKASEALIMPDSPMPLFSPVMPTREGHTGLVTLYEDFPHSIAQKMKGPASLQRGGSSLMSGQPPLDSGAGSQLLRLSAVEDLPAIEEILQKLKKGVKTTAPYATGAGAAATALSPGEAQADTGASGLMDYIGEETKDAVLPGRGGSRKPIHDPPLETPLFDLADLVTAPIGVAGAAGKALSVAATPFLSAAQEYIMEKAPGLWELLSKSDQAYDMD